ncbi:MAG: GxxExxY protein [Bacteroidetes bacterium]|nr:GxxExxY protein [Bacteroidota bacterium]
MSKKIIDDLIYPDLSFKIVGCAFEVYNELGYGHAEKNYQKALAVALKNKNILFKEQAYFPLKFQGEIIGRSFCDFVVDDKVIVELKKNARFSKANIDQVNQYLKSSGLKLAILINYTSTGAIFKRLVNIIETSNTLTKPVLEITD